MSNTKQITISDTYGISKEWIESKKRTCDSNIANGSPHIVQYSKYMLEFITHIESQLFPIEPIVKDAFTSGANSGKENTYYDEYYGYSTDDEQVEQDKQSYLTQPITIKLKDNGK